MGRSPAYNLHLQRGLTLFTRAESPGKRGSFKTVAQCTVRARIKHTETFPVDDIHEDTMQLQLISTNIKDVMLDIWITL